MKELILKILREQLEGIGENPLSEKEIRMFKYVNKQKENLKTQKDFLDMFKTMMQMVNRPETDARFYYEIYTANYRPEGDYENLTKQDFKHYREFKQRRTPNNTAYEYSTAKLPFKGSNLEGFWDVNNKNQWYYVVTSYNWYPIYLFIDDKWYRVSDSYSSSTAKHLSGANPMRRITYDENLGEPITLVTSGEIKKIRDGEDMELIKTNRVRTFMDSYGKDFHKQKSRLLTIGWGDNRKKVKYSVNKVEENNGKIVFTINIEKAGPVEGKNKLVVNPEGYHHPSPFSEDLEKGIKQKIISDYSDYLKRDNTEFIFNHPNQ